MKIKRITINFDRFMLSINVIVKQVFFYNKK